MSDLRERVAVAIMTSGAGPSYGDTLRKMADAAIAICMEKAARVCDEYGVDPDCTAAIRALATNPYSLKNDQQKK